MNNKIDFVIIWVDGNDPKWKAEKNKYLFGIDGRYNTEDRYRDWDNLQYWFRGVEKFAPFVNKIHFVTEGHLPKWLNTSHPKLNIVKHKDYMPEEYLPTFSSFPIELNMHKIKGLEENFVFFNDDMFLTNFVKEEDFFINNKPVEYGSETAIRVRNPYDFFSHIFLNCIILINKNFDRKICMKKYEDILEEKDFFEKFCGFSLYHLAQPFKKKTFEELWEKEGKALDETSKNKFRTIYDVCQYVFRYWQIAEENVVIKKEEAGKGFLLEDSNIDEVVKTIKEQKYKQICINDSKKITDFEKSKNMILEAFESILPEKSQFEK